MKPKVRKTLARPAGSRRAEGKAAGTTCDRMRGARSRQDFVVAVEDEAARRRKRNVFEAVVLRLREIGFAAHDL
jgi:hypothetical protein